jgi:hypothetical protein
MAGNAPPCAAARAGDNCLYVLANPWDPGEVRIGDAAQTIEKLAPCENLSLLVKHSYPGLAPLAGHYHARFASLLLEETGDGPAGGYDRAHWFRLSALEADRRIRQDVEERLQRCKEKIALQLRKISVLRAAVPGPREEAPPSGRPGEEGASPETPSAPEKSRAPASRQPKSPRPKKRAKEGGEKLERFTVVTKAGMSALFGGAPEVEER